MDANYTFILASLGAAVNTHDSTLLKSTMLWSNIVTGDDLFEGAAKTKDDIVIPRMRSILLKPYGDGTLLGKKNISITEQVGEEWLLRVLSKK